MPSRYSSDHSLTDAEKLCAELGIESPDHPHRARPRRLPRHAGAQLRRPRARPHRGEHPVADPGHAPHGAVEQVRLAGAHHRQQERDGRRLLHALRRHGRRLRGHQGRAQDAGLRAGRATATPGRGVRSSPRTSSPSRPRPSCAPTSATTSRCRPTRCSTRSSRPTWRTTAPRAELVAIGLRRRTSCERVTRLVDVGRVQAAPDPARRARHDQGLRQGPPPAHHQPLPRLRARPGAGPGAGAH